MRTLWLANANMPHEYAWTPTVVWPFRRHDGVLSCQWPISFSYTSDTWLCFLTMARKLIHFFWNCSSQRKILTASLIWRFLQYSTIQIIKYLMVILIPRPNWWVYTLFAFSKLIFLCISWIVYALIEGSRQLRCFDLARKKNSDPPKGKHQSSHGDKINLNVTTEAAVYQNRLQLNAALVVCTNHNN